MLGAGLPTLNAVFKVDDVLMFGTGYRDTEHTVYVKWPGAGAEHQ
jgi:hypothetical protein